MYAKIKKEKEKKRKYGSAYFVKMLILRLMNKLFNNSFLIQFFLKIVEI